MNPKNGPEPVPRAIMKQIQTSLKTIRFYNVKRTKIWSRKWGPTCGAENVGRRCRPNMLVEHLWLEICVANVESKIWVDIAVGKCVSSMCAENLGRQCGWTCVSKINVKNLCQESVSKMWVDSVDRKSGSKKNDWESRSKMWVEHVVPTCGSKSWIENLSR